MTPRWLRYLVGITLLASALFGQTACHCSAPPPEQEPTEAIIFDGSTESTAGHDSSGSWQDGVWSNPYLPEWTGLTSDTSIPPDVAWQKPKDPFVQRVVRFAPSASARFGHNHFPQAIQGPPQGAGEKQGSLHVVSLGCGGSIILEFSNPFIGNGPGPDFIIFENAFSYGGTETFVEPAQVSVSIDGKTWYDFPCQPDKTPWPHPQCAGIRPVFAHPNNNIDPQDPKAAGGDAFDLADVGLSFARFIKIEDRSHLHPDAKLWCGGDNAGFDLDAISILWGYRP